MSAVARSLFGVTGGYRKCRSVGFRQRKRRILESGPEGMKALPPGRNKSRPVNYPSKNGAIGLLHFSAAVNYFLMRMTEFHPPVTLLESLISSLISSMLEITTGVRVDLAFLPAAADRIQ